MAFSGRPGHRQDQGGPVERLDLGLLVDADHHRLLRRVQIQPDDVADLGVQLRVGGELERLPLPRLQIMLPPDAGDRGEGNPQVCAQQPSRPVRHPQGLRRGRQRGHHDRQVIDHRRTTRPIEITETRDARLLIAATPGQHRGPRHPDPAPDLRVRHTLSSEQHDPGALGHTSTRRRAPQHRSQSRLITGTQHNRRSNRHTPLSRTPTIKSLTTRDTRNGKRRTLSTHERIAALKAKQPVAATSLEAVKWVGNQGSHASFQLTATDCVESALYLDHALRVLYDTSDAEIIKKAKAVNRAKGIKRRRDR